MKRFTVLLLIVFLFSLAGCSIFDGQYVHVVPHEKPVSSTSLEAVSADNYVQIRDILKEMAVSGRENEIIYVANYDSATLAKTMYMATRYLCNADPVGSFAVEDVTYEVGTNSGKTAVAVSLHYRHSSIEVQKIRHVADMEAASASILRALENCDARMVLLIDAYEAMDIAQLVDDLARANPQSIMETPTVSEGIYGSGPSRVLELSLTYENSRDSLRQMQTQVRKVFDAAALYVSSDAPEPQKFSQMYAFLMERFDYTIETSITASYSLLHHGVGDSRAFANVYAAMCKKVGLECLTVTGTHQGEPWSWNIVCDNGVYYHVDLLRCSAAGGYQELEDSQMVGYVWDFSAYPSCGKNPQQNPPETEPSAE